MGKKPRQDNDSYWNNIPVDMQLLHAGFGGAVPDLVATALLPRFHLSKILGFYPTDA